MSLVEVFPWQHESWQQIEQAQIQNRLPHAILLSGMEGIGKRHFAIHLAQALLCLSTQRGAVCGVCKSCVLLSSANHPDLMFLEPDEPGKQIKIDEVRDANEFLQKTAQQGGAKVLIINPAEAMNSNASNALLKTLEEPTPNSYILLLSHSLSRLLATIRSRCHRYDLPQPTEQQAKNWLLAQSADSEDAEDALLLAGQRPLLALSLINQKQTQMAPQVIADLQQISQAQISVVEVAERWKQYEFNLLLQYLCVCLNDIIRWQMTADESQLKNKKHSDFYAMVAQQARVDRLFNLYKHTLELREQGLSKANISRVLLLENLLIQWQMHCTRN